MFQKNTLKFAEDDIQWLQHINGTKYQSDDQVYAPNYSTNGQNPIPNLQQWLDTGKTRQVTDSLTVRKVQTGFITAPTAPSTQSHS